MTAMAASPFPSSPRGGSGGEAGGGVPHGSSSLSAGGGEPSAPAALSGTLFRTWL